MPFSREGSGRCLLEEGWRLHRHKTKRKFPLTPKRGDECAKKKERNRAEKELKLEFVDEPVSHAAFKIILRETTNMGIYLLC